MAGSTTERGYGYTHQQERKRWAPSVARGEVTCSRYGIDPDCPGLIEPGEPWDLDHDDDRQTYRGPAHRACNRRAGADITNGKPAPDTGRRRPRSREW